MAYKAIVKRVIDGDSFEGDLLVVEINVVFPDRQFRLKGVDTPERNHEQYEEAKAFTQGKILNRAVDVDIHGKNGTGNFGRYLVTVNLPEQDTLNQQLLDVGLAEVYKK